MGAWAEDTFGNDAACDWIGTFLEDPGLPAIKSAIATVLHADDYLGSGARLGPVDAPLKLVVFSSFQCPSCRELAKEFPYLTRHFGAELTIVFKHYPLSTACNPVTRRDHHPRACQAANQLGRSQLAAGPNRRKLPSV